MICYINLLPLIIIAREAWLQSIIKVLFPSDLFQNSTSIQSNFRFYQMAICTPIWHEITEIICSIDDRFASIMIERLFTIWHLLSWGLATTMDMILVLDT